MLVQSNDQSELELVYAASRRTSPVEKEYHSSKLEFLAIVWAMERLRPLLIAIHFELYTDCEASIYVNSMETKNLQTIRWLSAVADFHYDIHHRKGERMQHVDALSRASVEDAERPSDDATIFNVMVREDEILMYQRHDEMLNRKIQILEKNERDRTRREKGEIKDYVLRNGILYKLVKEKELYVVPRAMRKSIVIKNHDLTSHFGVDRTVTRICNYYYFPRLHSYVRRHIANYVECILAKNKVGKQEGELHPIPPGSRPFEIIHIWSFHNVDKKE